MNAKEILVVRKLLKGRKVKYTPKKVKVMVKNIHSYACMNLAWQDKSSLTCYIVDEIYTCESCPHNPLNFIPILRGKL